MRHPGGASSKKTFFTLSETDATPKNRLSGIPHWISHVAARHAIVPVSGSDRHDEKAEVEASSRIGSSTTVI